MSSRAMKRRGAAGYTLVEVMVAVLVIGLTMIALYLAFGSGFAIVGLEREDLRATQIMTRKLEGIRLCNWGQLTNRISFVEYYDPVGAVSNEGGMVYTGTLTTNGPSGVGATVSYRGNMRLVTVSVSWTNYTLGKPVVHRRSMQTQVARFGMQNYVWGSGP